MFELKHEEIKDTSFQDMIDIIVSAVEESGRAHRADVQYYLKEDEIALWSMDLITNADIIDVAIFVNGLNQTNSEYPRVHTITFKEYNSNFKPGGTNWRLKREGSPDQQD